jgi:hypothetical protein
MEKIMQIINKKASLVTALFAIVLGLGLFTACEKEETLAPAGPPVINSVILYDTLKAHKDSLISGAEPFRYLVIKGKNLTATKQVFFNDLSVDFNPTYNTDTDLIIYLPGTVPTGAKVSNKLKLVTTAGAAEFGFKIIAKAVINERDKITFGKDRGQITLRGKNLEDVSAVVFNKSNKVVKIISKAADKLVLEFPETEDGQVTLDITNSSGVVNVKDQVYVNADVAIPFYTDGFGSGFSGDSWDVPVAEVSDAQNVFAGTKSVAFTYPAGGWKWVGFTNWWPRLPYSADHKYITFSIKGGDTAVDLWITTENTKAGFAEFPDKNKITVQPKIWNYYKLAIADLDFWYAGGADIPRMGFRPKGPDKKVTLYFDDVMLIK